MRMCFLRQLSPAQLELQTHEVLVKHWRSLAKKEARAAKEAGDAHVPVVERPEAAFIPSLLDEFLGVRRRLAGPGVAAALQCVHIYAPALRQIERGFQQQGC